MCDLIQRKTALEIELAKVNSEISKATLGTFDNKLQKIKNLAKSVEEFEVSVNLTFNVSVTSKEDELCDYVDEVSDIFEWKFRPVIKDEDGLTKYITENASAAWEEICSEGLSRLAPAQFAIMQEATDLLIELKDDLEDTDITIYNLLEDSKYGKRNY